MMMNRIPITEVRRMMAEVPGLAGVGFGLKETGGKLTQMSAWRFYVAKKLPKWRLTKSEHIPTTLLGLPTDVIQSRPTFSPSRGGLENSLEGAMIANGKGVPGTLGCWAVHETTKRSVLLSNYHVLFGKGCKRGDTIWKVQRRGVENHYEPIGKILTGKAATVSYCGADYFIDAAIAEADLIHDESSQQADPGKQGRAGKAMLGSVVSKVGAATHRTFGMIVDFCYPDQWYCELRSANAPNQLLIQPIPDGTDDEIKVFSCLGDSGAVIRDESGCVVGLLWGSNSRGEGVACHIGPVVSELGIRFGTTE
jgi:hypothetical protein